MDAPVIIVGGGPVGLSLALGLSRYGVRSIVLEKEVQPSTQSRALAVWARTLEHAEDWGAAGALRAAGIVLGEVSVCDGRTGSPLMSIDFNVLAPIADQACGLVIAQYETERVLREHVTAGGLCEIRAGCEVLDVTADSDGVTVRASMGNARQTLRAEYVAGCDGAHGVVREALGLTLAGLTYGARAVLSDDVFDGDDPAAPMIRFAVDHPGFLFGIRFAPRTWRIIAFVPRGMDDETALSPAVHAQRVCAVLGRGVATQTIWKSLFHLHRRRVERFVVGRVILAGDAAHLVSPAGGEGMNAGIQDAGNLAWKLASAVQRRGDAALLLQSYDAERPQMIADTVDRISDRLTRFAMGTPPWLRAIAISIAGRALRSHGIQSKAARAVAMLDGRYTKSPIIDSRHPLAGRRIDDLVTPSGSRISRERAGGAALVAVGDAGIDDLRAIRLPRPPKRWCIKPPAVLIVRPDGIVAAVIEKPARAKIEAAWQRAFAGERLPQASLPGKLYGSMRSSIDTL